MYVAIEGIKGTGKSTIISSLINDESSSNYRTSIFPITASMGANHPLEIKIERNPFLKFDDAFIERLFIERAYWNQSICDKNASIILGDRSIATAYVTRWYKWNDPYYTIKRVNAQYAGIRMPDVIVWLSTKVASAQKNIERRIKNNVCSTDEKYDRLIQSNTIYEELFACKLYHKKIKNTQLITVINNDTIGELKNEIQSIIKFYSKL